MIGAGPLAAQGPLQWQPHLEVWVLLAAVLSLGFYVTRIIQPKMVAAGEAAISRRQKGSFLAAMVVLALASDWPVHDLAEEYLFSIHMVQHLVLTLIMPPLFLLATPAWLVRLVFGAGRVGALISAVGRPLFAGLLYNALVVLTHAAPVVNASVKVGPLHYLLHSALVVSALLMWNPVCGPVRELRLSLPTQMAYLFGMSVIPTIPAAFLTVAENPLYRAYERGDYRLWGINIVQDQQAAGLIMKLGGGFYLWSIIIVLFVRWSSRHQDEARGTPVRVLTYEAVAAQFDATVPAVSEPAP